MPGHVIHDGATVGVTIAAAPLVTVAAHSMAGSDPLTAGVAFVLGGLQCLFINPDLDVDRGTYAHRRLGLGWKLYWLPYAKMFKHRGVSHWPVIGTATRIIYFPLLPALLVFGIISTEFFLWMLLAQIVADVVHWGLDKLDKALGGAL